MGVHLREEKHPSISESSVVGLRDGFVLISPKCAKI